MPESETRTLADKFMLRLPDGMRDRIKAAAAASNRSMNAEIVATLEEKYPTPPPLASEIAQIITLIREASRPISLEEKKIAVNRLNSILEKTDSPIIASIERGALVLSSVDESPDSAD